MEIYGDPAIVKAYPKACRAAERFGLDGVYGGHILAPNAEKRPYLVFYTLALGTGHAVVNYTANPGKEPDEWAVHSISALTPNFSTTYLNSVPQHFAPRMASVQNGMKQLRFMERVVGKLGYRHEYTAAMLALYSYRVGSHYKSGKAPDSVDEAWAHMREVGRIITNARLSGEEKIDFAIRNGTAADLEQVLTDDVPYSLVADMFSLYSHTDYLR